MTDHAGASTVDLQMGFITIDAGRKQPISGTIPLQFIVNGTWIAGIIDITTTVSASAYLSPPLSFLDSQGLKLTKLSFESIYGGSKSGVQTITAVNGTDSSITVTLTPEVSPTQVGSASDTYGSLYLSNDNSLYYQTIDVVVPANDTTDFYVYYQPPSNSKIGGKEWNLDMDTDITINDWLYNDNLTLTSTSPNNEYDAIILVAVDYETGKMETDFSDIRFWLEGTLLDSSIFNKVDSDYANFTVKIPALSPGEVLTLNVLSGNSTVDVKQDYVYTEGWDWLDGTLNPWIQTASGYHSGVYVGDEAGWGHNTMIAYSYDSQTDPEAYAPATGAYGQWTMRYRFSGGAIYTGLETYRHKSSARWYFANDGVNSYSVYINNDSETITLYKNSEVLDTTSFARNLSTRIMDITRNRNGEINVSVDGTEYLTATDTVLTTSIKENIWFHSPAWYRYWHIDYINFIEDEEYPPTLSAFDNWDDRLDLPCYGNVLFQSRELPELDAIQKYGCRVEGNYYE